MIGETVTAHFVPFGNVRGRIAHHIDGGFVVDIDGDRGTSARSSRRASTWYKKRLFSGVTDKREHKRFMPREPKSAVVLHDGTVLPCLVIDLSSSGAAISADHDPQIGEPLAVGKAVARVVRKLEVGFAVQFVTPVEHDSSRTLSVPQEWDRAMARREALAAPNGAIANADSTPQRPATRLTSSRGGSSEGLAGRVYRLLEAAGPATTERRRPPIAPRPFRHAQPAQIAAAPRRAQGRGFRNNLGSLMPRR